MGTDNSLDVLLIIDMPVVEYLAVYYTLHAAYKTETIEKSFKVLVWLQTHYHLELPYV